MREAFGIFVVLLGVFPIAIYYLIKANRNEVLCAIFPFLWVVCIASLYEFFGTLIMRWDSKYWFIVYKVLAFFALHYFFYTVLKKKIKALFVVFIVLFLLLFLYYLVCLSQLDFFTINSYFNALQTIIVLTFSILWIRRIFITLEVDSLVNTPNFYFISGLVIYYAGTVFLFLLSNLIFKTYKSEFQDYWFLVFVLNLVVRTLLILGIWKTRVK
jgi:hypothetical protein